MTGLDGLLCEEIRPTLDGSSWVINIGLVSLSLPATAIEREPDLAAFLRCQKSSQEIRSESQWVHALVKLLDEQGCVTASTKQLRSAVGIARLHARFSNWWYSRYYGHPIWNRLRADLSTELFAQWAKRTYYLSKSAGATAARSVTCSSRKSVRAAFLKSAIEEYSHHHSFYSLQPLLDKIGQGDIAFQGATPGCVAFDDQMLSIATRDDCAHVFVALFQENTAEFSNQANHFYDFVESRLNIPGALAGWRTHISFDHEHGHASDFKELLKEFIDMSEHSLRISVLRASATLDFLVESFNELGPEWTKPAAQVSDDLREEFLGGLGRVMVVALSHCIEKPNSLVAFGRVVEALSRQYPVVVQKRPPALLGALALLNRLEHAATQPERFAAALAFVLTKLGERQLVQVLGPLPEVSADAQMLGDAEMLSYAMSAWDRPINCFLLEDAQS